MRTKLTLLASTLLLMLPAVIVKSQPLTASITPADTAYVCAGMSIQLTGNPSGGTQPYQHNWSSNGGQLNPVNTQSTSFVSAVAGYFQVIYTVTDNATNTGSDTLVIVVRPLPVVQVSPTQQICLGSCVTITATGGSTYSWSPATGLSNPGIPNPVACPMITTTFTVTVTDANGCFSTSNTTVNVNPNPVVNAGNDQYVCPGQCAGLNASGGFSYSWSPSAGLSATNLPNPSACPSATTQYWVTVTTLDGCTATDNVMVTVSNLSINTTSTPASCGQCNGTVAVTQTGGISPFTYVWSTGSTVPTQPNLCFGPYYVTASDAAGCTAFGSVTVNNNTTLTDSITTTQTLCSQCTGTADIIVSGGTPPYSYLWATNDVTQSVGSLCFGNYGVTVTDNGGCNLIDHATITDTSTLQLVLDTIINMNCFNNTNGTITVHATGGAGGYIYSWSPGSYTTSSITNLSAGNYAVTVTDANGCTRTAIYSVSYTNNIYASVSVTPSNCGQNGSASIYVAGGHPPYSYLWSDSLHQTTSTAVNLTPGLYTVNITDSSGCMITAAINMYNFNCYNVIKGRVYNDQNQNCIQDSGELGIQGSVITATPDPYYAYSDVNGNFTLYTTSLNNTLTVSNSYSLQYTPTCPSPATLTVNLSQQGDTSLGNNFGFWADPNYTDLGIHPGWSGATPGFQKKYWIYYSNLSPTPKNATINFVYDTLLAYDSCTTGGVRNAAQHKITWTISNIPTSNWDGPLYVYFTVPTTVTIYDILHSYFEILPISGDANPLNNTLSTDEPVTGSHDPNDKTVSPIGEGPAGNITQNDSVLLYTLHFQNTGNDTAFTVVIKDTLSPFLDPATVVPGASNHTYTFDLSGQGVLTFRFDHILLPDSSANEEASNGYVNYSIQQKHNNPVGTVISNNAHIYFDFNPDVVTNTVINTITNIAGIETINNPFSVKVYPNPFTDITTFVIEAGAAKNAYTFEMYDVLGNRVRYKTGITTQQFQVKGLGLNKGIYFYKISDDGSIIGVGKVIIE